jgi:hypothetical protein
MHIPAGRLFCGQEVVCYSYVNVIRVMRFVVHVERVRKMRNIYKTFARKSEGK